MKPEALHLADVHRWPPTVNVSEAARALGISRASAYEAIQDGRFPAKTLTVGHRTKVVTASLIALLSDDSKAAG